MTNIRETLSQLDIISGSNKAERFFLQTGLKDEGREGFHLVLSDGQNVWEGEVSEDDLDRLSGRLKMDFNSYVSHTAAAFTRADLKEINFEYQLKKSADAVQFVWKKHIPSEDVKFQLGAVMMSRSTDALRKICEILSQSVSLSQEFQTRIKFLESENERLAKERQNALKRLGKCVTAKEELEKDLYSKFTAVLNSKKEKIRWLKENGHSTINQDSDNEGELAVASTSKEDNSIPQTEETKPAVRRQRTQRSVEDGNTDDEQSPPPTKQKRRAEAKRTSTATSLVAETSLNLGEDEEMELGKPTTVARRPRRQAPAKKETPSKPILPRVSSGNASQERPGSAARKSSLRKSGSNNSNRSTDNLDPDDLLDDM